MAVIPCCGHNRWYSNHSSSHTTIFYLLIENIYHCRSRMLCTIRNVTIWHTCFLETNQSSPFDVLCWYYVLLHRRGISALALTFSRRLEALQWLTRPNNDLVSDTRDVAVGPMCTKYLWKCKQLLVAHWSRIDHLNLDSLCHYFWVLYFSQTIMYLL